MHRLLLATVPLLVLSCIPTTSLTAQAPPSRDQQTLAPYLKPQRIIKIADGRTINLVCLGEGSPTVVLTAGLGGWSQVWYRIQETISHTARTCAWDPAGLGFSSPSPEPQDAVHEMQDLEQALKLAQLNGPYVLVGHSAGALVTVLFADKHRSDVVGMVLLDPAIPDQAAIRQRIAPKWGAAGSSGPAVEADRLQQCIVLTAEQHPFPPDMPADLRQQINLYFQALAAGHRAYAALSSRGRTETIQDSAHFIQFDDPAAVTKAINRVLTDVQNKPPKSAGAH
jgi:pimeloyl-ACP methyl ester carboxylesterase